MDKRFLNPPSQAMCQVNPQQSGNTTLPTVPSVPMSTVINIPAPRSGGRYPNEKPEIEASVMVGVPGKYKGCETCRRRRVKCSNERPYCQKCISGGRECEGYERERVFITGTPEAKGRVASHPKKVTPSKRPKPVAEGSSSKPGPEEDDQKGDQKGKGNQKGNQKGDGQTGDQKPRLVPLPPLTSAWDDHTLVSSKGVEYSVLITALHTKLGSVLRHEKANNGSAGFRISLPPYAPPDLQPSPTEADFSATSQCLARLPGIDEGDDAESYCVFLFEHNMSVALWEFGPEQMSLVRRLGPAHFRSFPNHHYFVRVYRPLAASVALLNRQETLLSAPEWLTAPWAEHPKSSLDELFDLILLLPSIFARTDFLKPMEATLNRRVRAQEILRECLSLERHFGAWFASASKGTAEEPLAYWPEDLTSPGGIIPFSNAYTFKDGNTGLQFLYYWMAQILFHRRIESLHRTIFQPVIDAYPNMWPDLPPELQIDLANYQHSRDFAADVCRGLDSALDSTVQPDMLVAPMTVAMDFYREINSASQDGMMEIMWLENFRSRLVEKGRHIVDVLQKQEWIEVATFK